MLRPNIQITSVRIRLFRGGGFLLGLLLATLPVLGGAALKPPHLYVPYLPGASIKVDGRLNEAAWSHAFTTSVFYQTSPGTNVPPSRRTVLKLFHGDRNLYIGIHCEDPDPTMIQRRRFKRDGNPGSTEGVFLALDPSGNAQKAIFIMITPMGDVDDGLIDLVTGSTSLDLDIEFRSATRIGRTGYDVELAIPFASLPIPSRAEAGPEQWCLACQRYIPRKDFEIDDLVPSNRASTNPKDSVAMASLDHLPRRASKAWHFLPSFVASLQRSQNEAPGDASHDEARKGSLELTGWWTPGPATQVKFTLNPDFSQVEADAPYQRVNIRFPVFIPEKRPFFLDPNDPFSTNFQLVNTRAIIDPIAGLRASTNQGPYGLYLLSALERDTPAERFGLAGSPQDTSWNFLAANHTGELGRYTLLATSMDRGGAFNRVVSLSGNPRLAGIQFNLEAVKSFTRLPGPGVSEGDAILASANYKLGPEWALSGQYQTLSPQFQALSGYVPDVGIRQAYGNLSWDHKPTAPGAFFREIYAYVDALKDWQWDGSTRTETQETGLNLTVPHQIQLQLGRSIGREQFSGSFFNQTSSAIYCNWMEHPMFQIGGNVQWGQDVIYSATPARQGRFQQESLSLLQSLGSVNLTNQWTDYEIRDIGGSWGAREAYLQSKLEFIFGQGMSFTVNYQWDHAQWADENLDNPTGYIQILFNYRPSAFTQFYVGFNRFRNDQKTLAGIWMLRHEEDNLFLKLAYFL